MQCQAAVNKANKIISCIKNSHLGGIQITYINTGKGEWMDRKAKAWGEDFKKLCTQEKF